MADPCQHKRLHFTSGTYYLFCADCGAKWCRHAIGKPEYSDAGGASPEASWGEHVQNVVRVAPHVAARG